MAFVCDIQIEGDPEVAPLKFCDALYVVADERQLVAFAPVVVWCEVCDSFQAGESPDSPEDIRKHIRDAEEGTFQGVANFLLESPDQIRQWAAYWQRQLTCRLVRQSPPKCLCCGSTAIWGLDERSPNSFVIPSSGKLAALSLTFDESAVDKRLRLYTPEGDLLGEIPRYDPCNNRQFDDSTPYDVVMTMLRTMGL
ncbi:hypothetical protein [Blastopirellula marina]|uniref:Uncharacterized protein n=1 Tax=Blastopirellula marina TaxID=124 RepID=A0A2S8GH39_9BACT|nr:hypothetical protein [Blastopirellula marina]PQO43776.1 hypothetical protein C5Y93_24400 [Blastopirellula marina]